jgi:hypothetical protein
MLMHSGGRALASSGRPLRALAGPRILRSVTVVVTRPRNMRQQLQSAIGTRATVLKRQQQTDRDHAYVGWWCAVHVADDDCPCDWCDSARRGVEHYAGYHVRDALVSVADYVRSHPD